MDDATSLAILSGFISGMVELVKQLIPEKYKDDKGLVFKRGKGRAIHISSYAVWPLLSCFIGLGVFSALKYNILGIGDWSGTLISGATVGTAGGSAWFQSSGVLKKLAQTLQGAKKEEATPSEKPSPGADV